MESNKEYYWTLLEAPVSRPLTTAGSGTHRRQSYPLESSPARRRNRG